MTHTKLIFCSIIALILCTGALAQDSLQKVKAQNGDGIFSLLRSEGMDVAKHYEEFLELNQDKIKNGSRLIIGEEYLIPNAPDSFKNRGVEIQMPAGLETPIFAGELASLRIIDSTLKNTVYYIIDRSDLGSDTNPTNPKNDIAVILARNLMQRKARVYMLRSKVQDSLTLLDFVGEVNKKYLRHAGDYQRLLVLNAGNNDVKSRTNVSVYHYADSKKGKKFADNILKGLGRSTVQHKALINNPEVFTDIGDIAFAKNSLPAVTFIDMNPIGNKSKKTLRVSTNKKSFAEIISNGILSDYSNTEFEDTN